jgi:hypothetical protein
MGMKLNFLILFVFLSLNGCKIDATANKSSFIFETSADGTSCTETYTDDVIKGWTFDKLHKSGFKDYGCQIVEKSKGHPVRSGEQSLRFEVKAGDCNSSEDYDDCANDRSRHELTQTLGDEKEGSEYWYHWAIYAPKSPVKVGDTIAFLGQFQQSNGVSRWMFEDLKDGYGLRVNDDGYNIVSQEVVQGNDKFREGWTGITLHIKWSSSSSGLLEVYVNESLTPALEKSGPTLSNNAKPTFHFGIYNAFISDCACDAMPTQIVYFDEVRRGNLRLDVE